MCLLLRSRAGVLLLLLPVPEAKSFQTDQPVVLCPQTQHSYCMQSSIAE